MDTCYSVERSRQQWLVAVGGVGFFLCQSRREALQTVRLATDLMKGAGRQSPVEVAAGDAFPRQRSGSVIQLIRP